MEFLIVLVILAAVVLFVSAPLRRPRQQVANAGPELGELEAAREAKYREIRDAELDHRTGKLSDEDYAAIDTTLRGEAIEIIQVIICVVLVFLVLMHSGKDSGLSGAFGVGTGAGPFGGGSLVERNLNRWTVVFAVAFVINTIVLIKIS